MGFMDKLKTIGGKALKGVALAAAHSYGTVTKGKYENCKVSLDTPLEKIVFIKITDIEAQHDIKEDVKTFRVVKDHDTSESYAIEVEFNDGEKSTISITTNKNQGSNLPTPEARIAARYGDVYKLVYALSSKVEIEAETQKWVNKIASFANKK